MWICVWPGGAFAPDAHQSISYRFAVHGNATSKRACARVPSPTLSKKAGFYITKLHLSEYQSILHLSIFVIFLSFGRRSCGTPIIASGAILRLEEATTISPGQSSGAKAEERHPGYMFPVYHVRPARTAEYSLLYAVALTERWYVCSYLSSPNFISSPFSEMIYTPLSLSESLSLSGITIILPAFSSLVT